MFGIMGRPSLLTDAAPTANVVSRGDQCVSIGQVFFVMGDHSSVQPCNLTWGSHHSSSPHFAAPRGPVSRVPAPLWVNHPAAQPPPPNGPNFSEAGNGSDSDCDDDADKNSTHDAGSDEDGKIADDATDDGCNNSIIVIHPYKNPVKTVVRTPAGVRALLPVVPDRHFKQQLVRRRSKLLTIKRMASRVKKHQM